MVSITFALPARQSMAIRGISPGDFQVIGAWPMELLPPKAAPVSQRTFRRAFMGDHRVIFFAESYQVLLGNDISTKSSGSMDSPGRL
ncbi:MAG: hypothetical protein COS90_04495 [Deltaproteobacteria bacterium CG07_land_8_20_14_0_80_60_11]|nr:MAG: hypothetical protein COS90_04495 [Deltaproteobacteria bacterium CG07_land_8_20_14_0_80_60_11]